MKRGHSEQLWPARSTLPAASGEPTSRRTASRSSRVARRRSAPKRRAWCAPSVGKERSRYPATRACAEDLGARPVPFGRDAFVPPTSLAPRGRGSQSVSRENGHRADGFRGSAQIGQTGKQVVALVLAGRSRLTGSERYRVLSVTPQVVNTGRNLSQSVRCRRPRFDEVASYGVVSRAPCSFGPARLVALGARRTIGLARSPGR